ncbi:MAG: cysteine desulfurase family protein [Proteobacteria bacterium]|nr:cysteine desulfurase family protein [Pseudomonadota bacterium]
MNTIYFDHISATPLHPLVKETMINFIQHDNFGNPLSQHHIGDAAVEALEGARGQVAQLIHANPEEIVFTSNGTESINHAIKGVAFAKFKKGKHIVSTNIEHQSVARTLRVLMRLGYQVTAIPVDKYGLVNPKDVEKAITEDTILVSIMHANNEIGTIEPIAEIGKITRAKNVLFHTDAVASGGNIPINVDELGVDLLSIAANQFYGPSGAGALYIRPKTEIFPLIDGGTQENNRRAGTQNILGNVGMGKAAELARMEMPQRTEHLLKLKKAFIEKLNTLEEIHINGHPELSLPGLVSVSVEYVEGESMMIMLAGSLRASHVLIATGCDYVTAQGTLIFSFGTGNTLDDIDKAFAALNKSVAFLRSMSPLYKKK